MGVGKNIKLSGTLYTPSFMIILFRSFMQCVLLFRPEVICIEGGFSEIIEILVVSTSKTKKNICTVHNNLIDSFILMFMLPSCLSGSSGELG